MSNTDHVWAPHEREGWSVCSRCGMVRNYTRETACRGSMPRIQQRSGEMTPEEREAQRRSFAYGNAVIDNPNVTREMVDAAAEKIAREE